MTLIHKLDSTWNLNSTHEANYGFHLSAEKVIQLYVLERKKNHLTTPRDRLIVVTLPSVLAWKLKDPNKMILQTTTHTKKERDEKVTLMWHVSLHGWSQKSFFITNFCLLRVIITKTVENCNFRWWRKCLHVIWIEYSCRSSSSSGDEKKFIKIPRIQIPTTPKTESPFLQLRLSVVTMSEWGK